MASRKQSLDIHGSIGPASGNGADGYTLKGLGNLARTTCSARRSVHISFANSMVYLSISDRQATGYNSKGQALISGQENIESTLGRDGSHSWQNQMKIREGKEEGSSYTWESFYRDRHHDHGIFWKKLIYHRAAKKLIQ